MSKPSYTPEELGKVKNISHHCHFPGCTILTPRKWLYCKPHWFMVPAAIRDRVWAAYLKLPHGPEGNCPCVSQEWFDATKDAQEAIRRKLSGPTPE